MGRHVSDFTLKELQVYRPELSNKPINFNSFWNEEKSKINTIEPKVIITWRDYPIPTVEVADVIFESWDGTPLKGLLVKPLSVKKCPVIISYHGYTSSRGFPLDYLKWTNLGIAVFAFDVRGQGDSPDFAKYENGSSVSGWMLKGIYNPENYYYTNVYRDILLQINWIRSSDSPVQLTKIGLIGSSQGGGLALSAAGLDGNIDFVIADCPFLANFERAIDIALTGPYLEIVNHYKLTDPQYITYNQVMHTLGYIDSVHFCDSITCPTLMTIGLEDAATPPSTVFSAFNHIQSSEKSIEVYPQFKHEGNPFHEEKKLVFVKKHLMK